MAGKAAKIIVSERQQVLLHEFSKSRTVAKGVVQRATIILLGFAGLLNEEIALQVGLNRLQVGLWRQRWRDAWTALCVWECTEPHRLREAILDVLSDAPRPGAPATFTAEQVCPDRGVGVRAAEVVGPADQPLDAPGTAGRGDHAEDRGGYFRFSGRPLPAAGRRSAAPQENVAQHHGEGPPEVPGRGRKRLPNLPRGAGEGGGRLARTR